ncbi:ubiquitin-like domain-containing protein [Sutcliffiella horikoshii]|uniref:G5 and 3D domain-containing protein n=1 Tax=Sutcliffiella horikoshii TaxID=79883 RepID=UPI00203D5AD3|nr:G5 and 3D domain-containing protein [Sutcliffiella horikoshii]MCM3620545.1 ubiquitin-like domain-containing protein [Sutcliffiella horikoshii]
MLNSMKKLFSGTLSRTKLALVITSFIVFSSILGFGVFHGTKAAVTVNVDGEEVTVRTHAKTVADILKELDIKVHPEDRLEPSKETLVSDAMQIVWDPAKEVKLVIDDKERSIFTTAETVQELLAKEEIDIQEHDKVSQDLSTPIKDDLIIAIEKAFEVTLNVGGEKQQVWSTSTTVADFLEQHDITVNELDRVEPSLEELVAKDAVVNITRVEKVTDVVEEPIDFGVVTKSDDTLDKGKEQVVQQGEEGTVANHYEVILENGKEVSRELVKTETVKESLDRIVAVGTKAPPPPQAQPQQVVSRSTESSSEEFYVSSTAYTAYCNGCSGVTSTGIDLRSNPGAKVIAVDPDVIPLGTKVYVEGYGYAVAGDTGGAIKGHKIDVFFSDKDAAYRWGRKKVKIKIVD